MNHAGEVIPDGFPVDTLTGIREAWEGLITPPRKSLAIVGSHPATRELAPYENQNFDIWLFNESPQKPEVYRRWTASFQMHIPEVYTSTENWVNKDHWAWLQLDHGDRDIWMHDVDPRVPNSRRYPLEGVLQLVPYKYLRSTPAMALALAIYLDYHEIWLYGSELSSNTEYTYQAINYAFWIGFAHGRGIDLHLECWRSEFYEQPIYGYEGELQVPKTFYEQRIKDLSIPARLNRENMEKVQGRMQEAMMSHEYQRVADLSINLQELAMQAGEASGALEEAERYLERTNPVSRQEYERVSAQARIDGEKKSGEMHHEAGKCEYVWNVWRTTGRLEALNQLRAFLKQKNEFAFEAGRLLGIMRENLQYMNEYDASITAAGGQRAVHQVEAGKDNGRN